MSEHRSKRWRPITISEEEPSTISEDMPCAISEKFGPALLEARGLTKTFKSGHEKLIILDDLDLTARAGESLAILGASGSGKSSLLYILGGMDRPSCGTLLFEGRDVYRQNEDELAAWRNLAVGFVFQFHHLLSDFTALENAALPARLGGLSHKQACGRARPLLERVGLEARLDHRPGELSGGEQQRVALARALVMEPKLLLADEPTGNLDVQNSEAVNELILELVSEKNLAAIIVTHNNHLASLVNCTLELAAGKLR